MDRTKPRFQYQQIAREIEDQILKGELRVGERLPSERIFCEQFNVQRNTVRQALAILEADGHIATSGRRGSYVIPAASSVELGAFVVNIDEASGPNGTALYEGIVAAARPLGFRVQRTNTRPLPNSSLNRTPDPSELPEGTVGVILWPHHPSDTEKLRRLNEAVPVVLVDHRVTGSAIDCVRFDDVTGGKLLTEHLLSLGHRKIAFLTDEVFADSVQARWSGYIMAHEEAGLLADYRLGLLYQVIDPATLSNTLRHLMANSETKPTAVVCANDLVAFKLLRLLSIEGLRVPKDIAVTGYGNTTPEYTSAMSLTTVHQPFYEMGLEASRILSERIRQKSADRHTSPLDVSLPVRLVLRGSA